MACLPFSFDPNNLPVQASLFPGYPSIEVHLSSSPRSIDPLTPAPPLVLAPLLSWYLFHSPQCFTSPFSPVRFNLALPGRFYQYLTRLPRYQLLELDNNIVPLLPPLQDGEKNVRDSRPPPHTASDSYCLAHPVSCLVQCWLSYHQSTIFEMDKLSVRPRAQTFINPGRPRGQSLAPGIIPSHKSAFVSRLPTTADISSAADFIQSTRFIGMS